MAKRKQNSISPQVAKIVGVFILTLVVGWFLVEGAVHFLNTSGYFKIKSVALDSSLDFINRDDVEKLKGLSIFSINLEEYQRKLAQKYPQVLQLRVVRHFPNEVHIVAQARIPLAQIKSGSKVLTLDENGLILSTTTSLDEKFPLIAGVEVKAVNPQLGQAFGGREVGYAIAIVKAFRENNALTELTIRKIDVTNLSSVVLEISNGIMVIIDRENLSMKMRTLAILLSRADFNPAEIKYVDLRFKEPTIGKKEATAKKK